MLPMNSQNLAEHSSHGILTVGTPDEQNHLPFTADNIFAEWEWKDDAHDDRAYTVGEILQSPGLDIPFLESILETTPSVNQSVPQFEQSNQDTAFSTDWSLEIKTTSASMAAVS